MRLTWWRMLDEVIETESIPQPQWMLVNILYDQRQPLLLVISYNLVDILLVNRASSNMKEVG